MADGMHVLSTLAEAGGISAIVAGAIMVLVRTVRKNGCTCRVFNCRGDMMGEIDCEKGAPTKRYSPKDGSESSDDGDVSVAPSPIKPSQILSKV